MDEGDEVAAEDLGEHHDRRSNAEDSSHRAQAAEKDLRDQWVRIRERRHTKVDQRQRCQETKIVAQPFSKVIQDMLSSERQTSLVSSYLKQR